MSPKSLYTIEYRRERRRRVLGWALVGIGAVMAVVHMITHLGRLRIIGLQDLLLGYPMAALLILVGFFSWALPPKPERPRRFGWITLRTMRAP